MNGDDPEQRAIWLECTSGGNRRAVADPAIENSIRRVEGLSVDTAAGTAAAGHAIQRQEWW
jgi:hypothetical protein